MQKLLDFFKLNFWGLALSLAVALLALWLSAWLKPLSATLISLIIGVAVGNSLRLPISLNSGLSVAATSYLEWSLVFLAFGISLKLLGALGWQSLLIAAALMLLTLYFTVWLSKRLSCPGSTSWLIGFGTAVCGSSAIAALSPLLPKSKKEEVVISLAVVNLLGTIGMLGLPLLLAFIPWSENLKGMITGASLHSVGHVAGAAYALSEEAGQAAVSFKMIRVALLSPALFLFHFLIQKREPEQNQGVKIKLSLPWYLIAFIAIVLLNSIMHLPADVIKGMDKTGGVLLNAAMAAIGFRIGIKTLFNNGKRGLKFGIFVFLFQLALILLWVFLSNQSQL